LAIAVFPLATSNNHQRFVAVKLLMQQSLAISAVSSIEKLPAPLSRNSRAVYLTSEEGKSLKT